MDRTWRHSDAERLNRLDCDWVRLLHKAELLNECLFFGLGHARVKIAAWVADYNTERPHSALGYQIPAAFGDAGVCHDHRNRPVGGDR